MLGLIRDKHAELSRILQAQQKQCEAILERNLAYIDQGLTQLKNVPETLFDDAAGWSDLAKAKLDLFEQNESVPNFINYDMLEQKDSSQPDILEVGTNVMTSLEEHKDVSFQ